MFSVGMLLIWNQARIWLARRYPSWSPPPSSLSLLLLPTIHLPTCRTSCRNYHVHLIDPASHLSGIPSCPTCQGLSVSSNLLPSLYRTHQYHHIPYLLPNISYCPIRSFIEQSMVICMHAPYAAVCRRAESSEVIPEPGIRCRHGE